jgi:hypothetical protein
VLEPKAFFKTKDSATEYEDLTARVALMFATESQLEAENSSCVARKEKEPACAVENTHVGGYKSFFKFEIPPVKIKGPIRSCLQEIFARVPHVSAAAAEREIGENPKFAYNMVVKYNVTEERCKRLWGKWAKDRKKNVTKTSDDTVPGWHQLNVTRLRAIATQLGVKGAGDKRLNKEKLIAMLPTWSATIKDTLVQAGIELQKKEWGDDDNVDIASDGEPEVDGNRGMEHNVQQFEDNDGIEDNFAEVIAMMAPPPARPKLQRRKRKGAVPNEANKVTKTRKLTKKVVMSAKEDDETDEGSVDDADDTPKVDSIIEVNVEAGKGRKKEVSTFYCTVKEYEEDGAVILHTQDGEVMNIFLEDYEWKQVYKCTDCNEYGSFALSCDACGKSRPGGT